MYHCSTLFPTCRRACDTHGSSSTSAFPYHLPHHSSIKCPSGHLISLSFATGGRAVGELRWRPPMAAGTTWPAAHRCVLQNALRLSQASDSKCRAPARTAAAGAAAAPRTALPALLFACAAAHLLFFSQAAVVAARVDYWRRRFVYISSKYFYGNPHACLFIAGVGAGCYDAVHALPHHLRATNSVDACSLCVPRSLLKPYYPRSVFSSLLPCALFCYYVRTFAGIVPFVAST